MTIPSFAGMPTTSAINAPSPVFLTGEEQLRVTSFGNASGLVLTVNGRILRPDNTRSPIQFSHTPNSNRTANTSVVPLSEGWLLGVDVRVTTGAPAGNAVWVLLELVSGSGSALIPLQALAWDFVSANNPLMYPEGVNTAPLEGAGCLRAIQGTAQGAGTNISETVPTGARWDLISFLFSMTTSATVANRIVGLTIDDGTNIYFSDNPNLVQAASALNGYIFAQGNNRLAAPNVLAVPGCLPVGVRLGPGHRIKTSTTLLQAGDVFSAPNYLVREWFDV